MTATIILPTYNEADNIQELIQKLLKLTDANILVVDDNSPDGTVKKVKPHKRVRVIVRKTNRGLTNSLCEGIANAKTDIVAWMDCDFSHPPEIMAQLIQIVEKGTDIAIAGRKINSGLSRVINIISQILFGKDITDYTTGFLAVKKTILDDIPLVGFYGEYCIDLLVRAKRKGYTRQELPYDSPPRASGSSKTRISYGMYYLWTIIKLLVS